MYKPGDNIMCKKDLNHGFNLGLEDDVDNIIFRKNKIYTVNRITDNILRFEDRFVYFYTDDNTYNKSMGFYTFHEYFYSHEEMRKLKLKTII